MTSSSGTWTKVGGADTDLTSSAGGRTATFWRVIGASEVDPTYTIAGYTTGINWHSAFIVRSDFVAGSSLTSSMASTERQNTVASTSLSVPQFSPTTDFDLRVAVWFYTSTTRGTGYPAVATPTAHNPSKATAAEWGFQLESSVGSLIGLSYAVVPAPEFDSTNPWSITGFPSAKSYVRNFVFTDGSGYNGGMRGIEVELPHALLPVIPREVETFATAAPSSTTIYDGGGVSLPG
jgi:hypothetical protein